ncbi:hypothetical protein DMENIID0001_146090 [Sergentomyia squamirostris]
MGNIQQKMIGSPFLPFLTVTCGTGLFWSSYKLWFEPTMRQNRFKEADNYAEFVYRHEQDAELQKSNE